VTVIYSTTFRTIKSWEVGQAKRMLSPSSARFCTGAWHSTKKAFSIGISNQKNILLNGPTVKIGDFGCAKLIDVMNTYRYTSKSFNIGTPMYSAPEILNM
jgi:serine/threonine protein kinase